MNECDFCGWRLGGASAMTLYYYSTLMRLVYRHDNALWDQFVREMPGIETVKDPFGSAPHAFPQYVIVKSTKGCATVVFEGTVNSSLYLPQLIGAAAQVPDFYYPGLISVHIHEYAALWESQIHDTLQEMNAGPVTICGHSLGGSIAQILSHRLENLDHPIEGCITEGAPRVGNIDYANGPRTFRLLQIQNVGDPVVALPPARVPILGVGFFPDPSEPTTVRPRPIVLRTFIYEHAGEQWLVAYDGSVSIYKGEWYKPFPPPAKMLPVPAEIDPTWQHFAVEYTRRLRSRVAEFSSHEALQSKCRLALDRLNTQMNSQDGYEWGLDLSTGLPLASIADPHAPAPDPVTHVTALDP